MMKFCMAPQTGYTKNEAGRHLFQLIEGSMIVLHKYRTYGIFLRSYSEHFLFANTQ